MQTEKGNGNRAPLRKAIVSGWIMLFIGLCPASSRATFFNYYGLGSRSTAMGGAATALASDSSAMYYNPGALCECGGGRYELIGMSTASNLNVGLRGAWEDALISREVNNTRQLEKEIEGVNELSQLGVGIVLPIWKDRLFRNVYFGMGGMFPLPDYAVRLQYYNHDDPIFLDYTNITHKFHILLGLGIDIDGLVQSFARKKIPGISVGFTLNTFFDIDGTLRSDPTFFELATPFDFVFIAGVLVQPLETIAENEALKSLKLGLVYRQELFLDLGLDLTLLGMSGQVSGSDLYSPEQWSFGLGLTPFPDLTVGYTIERYAWSTFEPPYLTPDESSNPTLIGMFAEEYSWNPFRDIWINRIGGEYTMAERYKFRGGYFFRPSPVSDQTGDTNFLDSDTHGISAGIGYLFEGLTIDFHVQYRYLADRKTTKIDDAGNPTGDSFTVGGNVWNFGLVLTRSFKAK